MKINKPTTRSHYIPKTYLKHFLEQDRLYIYKKGKKFFNDKTTSKNRLFYIEGEGALNNIGLENNLYNLEIEGFNSNDIEEIFREYGENYYDKIISELKILDSYSIIPQTIKDRLCLFMGAMRVRTPEFKWETEESASGITKHLIAREINNLSEEDLRSQIEKKLKEKPTEEFVRKIKKTFTDKSYDLKYQNNHFIGHALSLLEKHADIYHEMNMVIFKSHGQNHFITSDNPIVYFVPHDKVNAYHGHKNLMSPYVELYFPLTSNMCVLLSRADLKELIMPADKDYSEIINYNISHNSFDFIFSPKENDSLKPFIENFIPYPFKFTIS